MLQKDSDDYSSWEIAIMVKFRDNEPLQQLSGQRQSGGERSLATIMYLLALTQLSTAPFTLVDEINQGMDPFAERNVHNEMLEVCCKEASGQSFIITPKLLSNLNYHPKVTVRPFAVFGVSERLRSDSMA